MTGHVTRPASERGIALVIVLLMMSVLSGLATAFTMNGRMEAAMASNEVFYAGARAAAEAGMNRAIERILKDTTTNLLAGPDQLAAANAGDAVNADNGNVAWLFAGTPPYALGSSGLYSYTIDVLDDDDPELYTTPLTPAQKVSMREDVTFSPNINDNDRLILRVTGFGPKNTVVVIMRELQSVDNISQTTATSLSNPAILVNGDLEVSGELTVTGDEANLHANGNLTFNGRGPTVDGKVTSSGTFSANKNWVRDQENKGLKFGGGEDPIKMPEILAANYKPIADYILKSDGQTITNGDGTSCGKSCPDGWTFNDGVWTIKGNSAPTGTFYVEGSVKITGSPGKKDSMVALSVIAEGSIEISGSPFLKPENDDQIQFVANGDLTIKGKSDFDADASGMEGQILVREQIKMSGRGEFQGRILVQNAASIFDDVTANEIHGRSTITYNGTINGKTGAIASDVPADDSKTTYTNNVRGWIER